MNTQLIVNHISHKGGINNLQVVSVMSGYLTLAVFSGKTSKQRAIRYQNKFASNKGK